MIEVGVTVYDYRGSTVNNPIRHQTPIDISENGFIYIKTTPFISRGIEEVSFFRIAPHRGRAWRYTNRSTTARVPRFQWVEAKLKDCGNRTMRGIHVTSSRSAQRPKKVGRIIMEHRLIFSAYNGMDIDDPKMLGKDIHHRNENRHDNRIENLELLSRIEHQMLHRGETSRTEDQDSFQSCEAESLPLFAEGS
jgi:hypothetical protein